MRFSEVTSILRADVIVRPLADEDVEILAACGSDLISDVLCYAKHQTILLTGLTTAQVVRTASLLDLAAIVFVRGKRPAPQLVVMATELGIPILCTRLPMYEAAGRLYQQGLPGCSEVRNEGEEYLA